MSRFVVTDEGIVLNRTAAAEGRVPLAAWDIGSVYDSGFLSAQPFAHHSLPEDSVLEGKWKLVKGCKSDQILVYAGCRAIGQVNRRAAAILAPLLDGSLVQVDIKQNQQPHGHSTKALYVYAKLGAEGNKQIIREPSTTREMRAYVALLACTMKALKAVAHKFERDSTDSSSEEGDETDIGTRSEISSWRKLPGAVEWDFATGSVGNTVSQDLVDQLGSRTLAALRKSGAALVKQDI